MTHEHLPWPFAHVVNSRGEATAFIAVHGPVHGQPASETFRRLRRQFRFVGFTSYMDFPRPYLSKLNSDWLCACEAWCHCFRDPDAFLPSDRPRALISYSDFVDLRPHYPVNQPKHFDVAYVCPPGEWKAHTKNWPLAKRCLTAMLDSEPGFRIALVGRAEFRAIAANEPRVTAFPPLEHSSLLHVLSQSRCALFASAMDASPRLIPECLCLNVPVAVNRAILGGWKYVNRHTGRFFDDEVSALDAVIGCIRDCLQPCAWYAGNYGPHVSGRRLARLLRNTAPSFSETCVSPGAWRQTRPHELS
jgi:hypothetical protein